MKKIVAWGSVLVLMLSCTYVFAQPRVRRVKIPQSLTRVKRIPKNALKGELRYVPRRTAQAASKAVQAAQQPVQHVKPASRVTHTVQTPQAASVGVKAGVERSVARAEQAQASSVHPGATATTYASPAELSAAWQERIGRSLYDNQADLARDLAKFYGKEGGEPYRGILNEDLILYRVPEGISYHPAVQIFPKELDPQVDFVMYNPAKDYGQLLQKDILRLFKKVKVADERWKGIAKESYDNPTALARDVNAYYDGEGGALFQEKATQRQFIRYELPADGIIYRAPGEEPVKLYANEHYVMFDPVENSGRLVTRDATNPQQDYIAVIKLGAVNEAAKASEVISSSWKAKVYDSQAELARDVALFYAKQGKPGKRIQDPFGREFVLYELPSDRINYHQPGRAEADVLTPDKYAIMYNPKNNAGQVVQLDSDAMRWFTPVE